MINTYLLDSNNIIHKSKYLQGSNSKSFEVVCNSFLQLLGPFAQSYTNYSIIAVFDGKPGNLYSSYSNIQIKYSNEITADKVIKQLISKSVNPRTIAVVSSDREVQNYARIHAATSMESNSFLNLLKKPKPKSTKLLKEKTEKPNYVSKKEIEEFKKLFGA